MYHYQMISIHTTTRVVTKHNRDLTRLRLHFNPHHYESGDMNPDIVCTKEDYFNPHHYESGDILKVIEYEPLLDFNPHHYESGDFKFWVRCASLKISIHTTTRVVTDATVLPFCVAHYFNPHHYESGDDDKEVKTVPVYDFNPHHYESGDCNYLLFCIRYIHFNPHHYESGDLIPFIPLLSSYLFQSTPLREW